METRKIKAYMVTIQSAKGYGEDRLLNDCDGSVRCTSQQHQLNRRSEFIVVDM